MEKQRSYTPLLILVGIGFAFGGFYLFDRSKKLSKNFDISDLTRSSTADQRNIKEQKKSPMYIIRRERQFTKQTLQPVRDQLGSPIFINSWWRHPKTNVAVGGVSTSGHLDGDTVDIRTVVSGRFRNDLLAKAVLNSGVPFSKMILEEGTFARPKFIHLRASLGDNRRILLYKDPAGHYVSVTRTEILNLQ